MSEARQIQSMIDFIEREAQEKAEEVDAAAQEEYDIEKMRLMEAEKSKIRANLEKRKKQVDIDRRVARANYSKAQRLRLMDARAKVMDELHERTHKSVISFVSNPDQYKPLLEKLIQQCLQAIRTDTIIQCRKEDESIIKQMIPHLQEWYADLPIHKHDADVSSGNTNRSSAINSTVMDKITVQVSSNYLDSSEIWGGIIALSVDNRIICNNTLSYRTKTCFTEQLPSVRYYLFNPDAAIEEQRKENDYIFSKLKFAIYN